MKTLPFLFLLFELVASSSSCSSDGSTSCGESTGDGYCDPSSVGSADNCKDTDMSDRTGLLKWAFIIGTTILSALVIFIVPFFSFSWFTRGRGQREGGEPRSDDPSTGEPVASSTTGRVEGDTPGDIETTPPETGVTADSTPRVPKLMSSRPKLRSRVPKHIRSILREDPETTLRDVHGFKPGDENYAFLPEVPVTAVITVVSLRRKLRHRPFLHIILEHGQFKWNVDKRYKEVLSLRRQLVLLGKKNKKQHLETLPQLVKIKEMRKTSLEKHVPRVQVFINAVLNNRTYLNHSATAKFFEVSRISFVEDTGGKKKEGHLTVQEGGFTRDVDFLGFSSSILSLLSYFSWTKSWFVLKDSYLASIRSHDSEDANRTVAGVMLFDTGMELTHGPALTGIKHGIKLTTMSRDMLVDAHSRKAMLSWVLAIKKVVVNTGRPWVESKPFESFAPMRNNCVASWFVDGEGYMSTVADAIMAAKDEIFITDWQFSPHIFLKREGPLETRRQWRLDTLLLKKASEGVKIFIQLYKEFEPALSLGSEFAQNVLKHPNIVVFRHPDVLQTGVLLWAHHEKIVVVDQSLAFVGGIDLAFGRWDNPCHHVNDNNRALELEESSPVSVEGEGDLQKWVGKDFYNPFIRDFIELDQPFKDNHDRSVEARMPWHDIASAVYGAAARDVGRHFIQRYNFTKREQGHGDSAPFLLPRKTFTDDELRETQYLREVLGTTSTNNATVQALRSCSEWSAGIPEEHSILNAWTTAIEEAEHFIYIEQQFFISSLSNEDVHNEIAEALRDRIVRAYKEKQTFRVIVVIPLLPSFSGKFGEKSGTILEAVVHWNYRSISWGEDSLYGRLQHEDNIPEEDIHKYISVYGLRAHGEVGRKPVSEIAYVHSKLLIVDDRITIIGSANINDRSMLGSRDSEVDLRFEDKEMIDGTMNGQPYKVGKFSHSLRTFIFKEHLGLLDVQQKEGMEPAPLDVEDPACDEFYLNTWMKTAQNNTQLFEKVFGGKILPTDSVLTYEQLKIYQENLGLVGTDVDKARVEVKNIQGNVVEMPLHFLEKEDLTPDLGTVESLAPEKLLT